MISTRFSLMISAVAPIYLFKPTYAIRSVLSLSDHAIAYRWRSLPRVRRRKASKPQDSSKRVLPWQVAMDQLICDSLSHIHYWYEVGMLKVPASKCDDHTYIIYTTVPVPHIVARAARPQYTMNLTRSSTQKKGTRNTR